MPLRPTHAAAFGIVQSTLERRLAELIRAQTQASTGKRILQPSDDPVGASRAIDLRAEQALVARWRGAAADGQPYLDAANSALSSAQDLMGQIRTLAVQGLSGTMADHDRAGLADQIESLKASLLDVANTSFDGKHLFGGTVSATKPFTQGADGRVTYRGNGELQSVILGLGVEVPINVPGSDVFQARDPRGLSISGASGLKVGASPSQGKGWVDIELRHDATTGALGSGFALAGGGANDTILGDRTLVVDAAAHTVRLGSGPAVSFPDATDHGAADFVVRDEHGAAVHLDVTGWDGTGSTSTLTGAGSIRAGDGDFVALDLTQTDLELTDPTSGTVVRVNTTGVVRASRDVARFEGTVDVFAAIDGIVADLRNPDGLSLDEVEKRMDARLGELIRNQDAVLSAMGRAGAATQRLQSTDGRLADQQLQVAGRLSQVEDVDATEAILAMTRAQQSLELAQMTGTRLLQSTLLDYLK
jgi:flagellar hook-associated protein 3 FlgL